MCPSELRRASRPGSCAETFPAAAALPGIGVVEAQAPCEAFLRESNRSALNERQARRVDGDLQAAAFEYSVIRTRRIDWVNAVAQAGAAGGLHRQPYTGGAGMLGQLRLEELRRFGGE